MCFKGGPRTVHVLRAKAKCKAGGGQGKEGNANVRAHARIPKNYILCHCC